MAVDDHARSRSHSCCASLTMTTPRRITLKQHRMRYSMGASDLVP